MNKEEIELYKNSLKMEQSELAIELIQAYRKLDELENVIYKAIEYIEEGIDFPYYDEDTKRYFEKIRDILKGSDSNE